MFEEILMYFKFYILKHLVFMALAQALSFNSYNNSTWFDSSQLDLAIDSFSSSKAASLITFHPVVICILFLVMY